MSVVLKRTFLNSKVKLTKKKYPKIVLSSECSFYKLRNLNFESSKGAFKQSALQKSTKAGDDKPIVEKDAWRNLLTIYSSQRKVA